MISVPYETGDIADAMIYALHMICKQRMNVLLQGFSVIKAATIFNTAITMFNMQKMHEIL